MGVHQTICKLHTQVGRYAHFDEMSFVGAVGNLMADKGLESIMEVAFGGVTKMLSGKKYPQKVGALRLIVEELLQTVINNDTQFYQDLMRELQHRVSLSRTCKLWLDNLIKPVLINILVIRAERG